MNFKGKATPVSHHVAALLGCTMLAGLPATAFAQEAQPETAPVAAPAPQGDVIRTIAVAGAQRLEPETIVSYIKLRPGDVYTPAAAEV